MRLSWHIPALLVALIGCSPESPTTCRVAAVDLSEALRSSVAGLPEGTRVRLARLQVEGKDTGLVPISEFDGSEISVSLSDGSYDVSIDLMGDGDPPIALYEYRSVVHVARGEHVVHDASMDAVNYTLSPSFTSKVQGSLVSVDPSGTRASHFENNVLRFIWRWDDGTAPDTTNGERIVTHSYSPGSHVIVLLVSDRYDSRRVQDTVTVPDGNQPPSCDAGGPYTGTAGQPVQFDGSNSTDTDGTIVRYDWDFGDGSTAPDAGPTPTHTYADSGSFTVELCVTDDAIASVRCTTAAVIDSPADVTINELKVKGAEFIELYSDQAVDVTGWTLDDGTGPEILSGIVPAGGFLVVETTLSLNNSGAVVALADNNGREIDVVSYGNKGGAPLGFDSIGRSPEGRDTNDDARDFEYLDDSVDPGAETPGAPNRQGRPSLGASLIINELDPFGTGNPDGLDRVEIYNPFNVDVNLQGFVISDGDGYCRITAPIVVPANGFVVLTEDVVGEGMDCTGFDEIEFSSTDVAYLYDANNTRIDQLGILNAPSIDPGSTLQRCPDGIGPNDGFDYLSSGGDVSYFVAMQSLGLANNCPPTAVAPTAWGCVKAVYR